MTDVEDPLDTQLRQLATRVRRARRARNLSQTEFADRAGVSRSVVAELERSRLDQPQRKRPPRNITLDTLFRMAEALRMHPADLLDDRGVSPVAAAAGSVARRPGR